ncbi:hypothetical protein TIFTF001_009762 [Ficus carica]|uniref:Non-haem dioxygenase N-terminal domain-containing protein n=1 Tax=Ficus carica TaxID=3494 RepID=A0AA88DHJ8_FICCA|nr:hypothetical protein TIFTF001_009762 [Ficus carica]
MLPRSNPITETAPPPSPIPTGKGSRSASNEPFARFLDGSLQVPPLSLPKTTTARRSVPAAVDLRSLVSGAGDPVDRILRSAKDFGAFRIVDHGISVDELRLVIGEDERVFGDLERQRKMWIKCRDKGGSEYERRVIGDERYGELSVNMRHVASKIEAIAEQLNQILCENSGEKSDQAKIFEGEESVLSLNSFMEQNQLSLKYDEKESKFCEEYFMSLHIPFEHCLIYVQSEIQLLPFEAGPEALVVTIGKQLEVIFL